MSVQVNLKICVPYLYVTELYRRSATSDTNCSNQKPTVLKHLNSLRVSPPLNQLQLLTMLIRGPNHWAKLQELSTSRHLSLSPHAVSLLHLSAPRHWKKPPLHTKWTGKVIISRDRGDFMSNCSQASTQERTSDTF